MALGDVLGVLAGSFGAGLSEYGEQQARAAELARKRAEEERIRKATEALFAGGDLTPERAGAAITAGVSPTVVGSAQMFGRRMRQEPEPQVRESSTRGTITPMQIGEGLGYLNNWLNQPVAPAERQRRQALFRSFRDNPQYRTASPGEIGYYIKQAETSRLPATGLPTPSVPGAPGATLSARTTPPSGRPR